MFWEWFWNLSYNTIGTPWEPLVFVFGFIAWLWWLWLGLGILLAIAFVINIIVNVAAQQSVHPTRGRLGDSK